MKKIILLLSLILWLWISSAYQVDVPKSTTDINSEVWWSIDHL